METLLTNAELNLFIFNLQSLSPKDAIAEVMTAGLSKDEIIQVFNEITFNDTFKFKN